MFGRYLTTMSMTAVFVLTGCASHRIDTTPPVPRPLGNETEAYLAPADPEPPASTQPEVRESAGELYFRDALALSLLQNPRLADVSWSIRISEARALQAGLRPNPELEVELEEFGGDGPFAGLDVAETTVRLSQVIELGGKRGARRQVMDAETQLARYDYETERLTVLTDATLSFIDVLTAQSQLELMEDLYRLSEEMAGVVKERVRAGKVSPLEETKAAIELANTKIKLVTAKSNLRIARKRLAETWGSNAPQFSQATGTLDYVEQVPSFESLDSLVYENPAVARWAGEMEHRLAGLALERAQRAVNLTLSGGMRWFGEGDVYAFTVGISLPIPIFDRNQGGIQEARYKIAQTERRSKAAHLRITTALRESYEALVSARAEALALENEVVPAAGRAFEAARSGYSEGKFGYLEVLDSQRTFAEANARLIDSLARFHRAVALVESLVGTGLDSFFEGGSS